VACLGLWWRTVIVNNVWGISYRGSNVEIGLAVGYGFASCWASGSPRSTSQLGWNFSVFDAWEAPCFFGQIELKVRFGVSGDAIYRPLWFPAQFVNIRSTVVHGEADS